MTNQIKIRAWSRFVSLYSPQPHQPSQLAEPNTSFSDNNVSVTKSLPITEDGNIQVQPQLLKLTTPMTFPPSKFKVQPQMETSIPIEEVIIERPNGSVKKESIGEGQKQGIGTKVITIAGENRGACMQITKPHKKPIHKMGNSGGEEVNANKYTNHNIQHVNNLISINN